MSPPHGRDEQSFENECRDGAYPKGDPPHFFPHNDKANDKIKNNKEQQT